MVEGKVEVGLKRGLEGGGGGLFVEEGNGFG